MSYIYILFSSDYNTDYVRADRTYTWLILLYIAVSNSRSALIVVTNVNGIPQGFVVSPELYTIIYWRPVITS